MAPVSGHKWFAAFWDRMVKMEGRAVRKARTETLEGLRGRVLEIGCGNGANFSLYPAQVTELVATEPDPYMIERAQKRAAELDQNIEVQQAPAERLPFEDASFDAAVCTLVLCTVPSQEQALLEIKRILKPGGELRFFEHVRYHNRIGAFAQDIILPIWRWIGAGCHPNRDTASAIRAAGFEMRDLRSLTVVPPLPPMCIARPCILGVAIRAE